jgi:hypothetical protein
MTPRIHPKMDGGTSREGFHSLNISLCTPEQTTAVRCRIGAFAVLHETPEAIVHRRRQPPGCGTEKLPVGFFKQAEDQTVVGLAAVFAALNAHGWHARSFADWGVIAAPTFFGRVNCAHALQRFQAEGAWGASPHLVPQQSLHAISGTVSQALAIHGPNFGVGSLGDAFLLAAAMLSDGVLPGLWLVLTGHGTEWIPAADRPVPAPVCSGVALALTADTSGAAGPHLVIGHSMPGDETLDFVPDFHLRSFAEELSIHADTPSGKWRLAGTHWLT